MFSTLFQYLSSSCRADLECIWSLMTQICKETPKSITKQRAPTVFLTFSMQAMHAKKSIRWNLQGNTVLHQKRSYHSSQNCRFSSRLFFLCMCPLQLRAFKLKQNHLDLPQFRHRCQMLSEVPERDLISGSRTCQAVGRYCRGKVWRRYHNPSVALLPKYVYDLANNYYDI